MQNPLKNIFQTKKIDREVTDYIIYYFPFDLKLYIILLENHGNQYILSPIIGK